MTDSLGATLEVTFTALPPAPVVFVAPTSGLVNRATGVTVASTAFAPLVLQRVTDAGVQNVATGQANDAGLWAVPAFFLSTIPNGANTLQASVDAGVLSNSARVSFSWCSSLPDGGCQ
jgi:hypothetical protein